MEKAQEVTPLQALRFSIAVMKGTLIVLPAPPHPWYEFHGELTKFMEEQADAWRLAHEQGQRHGKRKR